MKNLEWLCIFFNLFVQLATNFSRFSLELLLTIGMRFSSTNKAYKLAQSKSLTPSHSTYLGVNSWKSRGVSQILSKPLGSRGHVLWTKPVVKFFFLHEDLILKRIHSLRRIESSLYHIRCLVSFPEIIIALN